MGERNILLITLRHFVDLSLLGEDLGLSLNCVSRGRGNCASKWRYLITILSVIWSILSSEWMIFPSSDDGGLQLLLGAELERRVQVLSSSVLASSLSLIQVLTLFMTWREFLFDYWRRYASSLLR